MAHGHQGTNMRCLGHALLCCTVAMSTHTCVDSSTSMHALSRSLAQVGLVWRDGLDASNLLLRGCTLRKTEWVIGVVIFTGGCFTATVDVDAIVTV